MNKSFEMKVIGAVSAAGYGEGAGGSGDAGSAGGTYGLAAEDGAGCEAGSGFSVQLDAAYIKGLKGLGGFSHVMAVSVCRILSVDEGSGVIYIDWIDADDGSPVIDIKPYHPSADTVRDVSMPQWCAHWPMSREESGSFDWAAEFNF